MFADLYLFVGRGRLVPVLPLYEGPERGYRPRPEDGVDGFRDGNPARSRISGNLRPATASAAGGGLQGGWTVAAHDDARPLATRTSRARRRQTDGSEVGDATRVAPPSIARFLPGPLCSLPLVAIEGRRLPHSRTLTRPFNVGWPTSGSCCDASMLRRDRDLFEDSLLTYASGLSPDSRSGAVRRQRPFGRRGIGAAGLVMRRSVAFLVCNRVHGLDTFSDGRLAQGGPRSSARRCLELVHFSL